MMQPSDIKADLMFLIFPMIFFFWHILCSLRCQTAKKTMGLIKLYKKDQQKEVSP